MGPLQRPRAAEGGFAQGKLRGFMLVPEQLVAQRQRMLEAKEQQAAEERQQKAQQRQQQLQQARRKRAGSAQPPAQQLRRRRQQQQQFRRHSAGAASNPEADPSTSDFIPRGHAPSDPAALQHPPSPGCPSAGGGSASAAPPALTPSPAKHLAASAAAGGATPATPSSLLCISPLGRRGLHYGLHGGGDGCAADPFASPTSLFLGGELLHVAASPPANAFDLASALHAAAAATAAPSPALGDSWAALDLLMPPPPPQAHAPGGAARPSRPPPLRQSLDASCSTVLLTPSSGSLSSAAAACRGGGGGSRPLHSLTPGGLPRQPDFTPAARAMARCRHPR